MDFPCRHHHCCYQHYFVSRARRAAAQNFLVNKQCPAARLGQDSSVWTQANNDMWPPTPTDDDTPVHFRIPMGRDPDILLSVDGSGNHKWSHLPDHPCERLASATTTPDCVTSFGRGPLIFVEVNIDGCYFTRPPLPDSDEPRRPTMAGIINSACAVLGRPSPFHSMPPQSGNQFMSSLLIPARLDVIADCLSSPCILTLDKWEWGTMFYIRVDLARTYHAYPHVGGPFRTLVEVYAAIDRDVKSRQQPNFFTRRPEESQVDYVVRQRLYWPDGTRKRNDWPDERNVDERRDRKRLLVQALVDKYNDYSGDLPYELKDVVHYELVCVRDAYKQTYHINFTAKLKGDYGEEPFFAQVTCDIKTGEHKWVVSCFCKIEPDDNGSCYGCKAKHPNAAVYSPGRADACFPFGASDTARGNFNKYEDPVAEEKRLRLFYENMGLNKPGYMEKERALMNYAFKVCGAEVRDGNFRYRDSTASTSASTRAPEEDGPAGRRSAKKHRPNPRYE